MKFLARRNEVRHHSDADLAADEACAMDHDRRFRGFHRAQQGGQIKQVAANDTDARINTDHKESVNIRITRSHFLFVVDFER